MKIIFVTSALHGGGAERVIATLANRFVAMGDDVTVLMTAGDECVYPLHKHVRLCVIGQASHGNPAIQIKRLFRMRRYFRAHPDSKIVSFSTSMNLFTIIAALGLKNRVIVSERNDPHRCSYRRLRNLVYAFGQGFVFQTKQARGCFPAGIRKKSIVIPNPVRAELPAVFTGKREHKIAAAGRLEPQKNHMLLLEAFAGFHRRFPDYTLHIFGKGSLEQALRDRAAELKIDRFVIFEGFRSDILETIRTYGMYVLSSDYEGISNSLMEAMALGLPCISTDCPIGGSALCIRDGINGLLVPVNNASALRKAMEKAASDQALADRLGRNGAKIREMFAEEKVADLWRAWICS